MYVELTEEQKAAQEKFSKSLPRTAEDNQFSVDTYHRALASHCECRLKTIVTVLDAISGSQFTPDQCDQLINEVGKMLCQIGGDLRQRSFQMKGEIEERKLAEGQAVDLNDIPF
jgi:hypothetical protein